MTEVEVGAATASDEAGEFGRSRAQVKVPQPKRRLTARFDRDVVDWFKAQGRGYQSRMNAVLRGYVDAQKV